MPNVFNNQLRQIILLALIIMLGLLLATTLYIFLPGFLGGITLFILTRKWYYKLTIQKKWGKGITAILFIFTSILVIAIPFYFSLLMVLPKISQLINKQQELIAGLVLFSKKIETYIGWQLFTAANAESMAKTSFSYVPSFLNSTANILSNLVMLFFLLYYLFSLHHLFFVSKCQINFYLICLHCLHSSKRGSGHLFFPDLKSLVFSS